MLSVERIVLFTLPPEYLFGLFALAVFLGVLLLMRMSPKYFYIVRHGQTVLNKQGIKQGAEGKLNERGEAQAAALASYLSQFPIKIVYSSPYERAVQTAEIIAKQLGVRVRIAPLLTERRNPSDVIGKRVDDPEVKRIVARIERGYHENNYRYSDEENFEDMKQRAAECLEFFRRHARSHVLAVTHHAFLQMLIAYALYRDDLDAGDYVKLAFFNPAENGGLTICAYHPWKRFTKTRGWEVIAYNESTSEIGTTL